MVWQYISHKNFKNILIGFLHFLIVIETVYENCNVFMEYFIKHDLLSGIWKGPIEGKFSEKILKTNKNKGVVLRIKAPFAKFMIFLSQGRGILYTTPFMEIKKSRVYKTQHHQRTPYSPKFLRNPRCSLCIPRNEISH